MPETVTTTAYPGLALGGRVAYIDPQLNEEMRTAQVRVEVPNPAGIYAWGCMRRCSSRELRVPLEL